MHGESRKWSVIVNPASGGGRGLSRSKASLDRLRDHGRVEEVLATRSEGHAIELAAELTQRNAWGIISVGGDGTACEVVNGIRAGLVEAPSASPPRLGILPVGTGNSFLRDLGISNAQQALAALMRDHCREVDLLEYRWRDANGAERLSYSLNLMGVGFVAEVGDLTNRQFKKFGLFGYVLGVLQTARSYRAERLSYGVRNGPKVADEKMLVSFCNSQCTGGAMRMAPSARIDDGLMDIVSIEPMAAARLMLHFPSIFQGKHVRKPEVSVQQTKRVDFEDVRERTWIVDGEIYQRQLLSIEVKPKALMVAAP